MIHSVDSFQLAKDINRHAEMRGRVIPVLIEVNSAKEEQKSGVFPEDAERLLSEICELRSIKVSGLMTMGPVVDDPELLRPYFRTTKALFDRLSESYGFGDCATLSMGMSDSYRVAIEEGSTLVRVGRRLFIK
jgi:pyridoxal phosphate enzyme (YggS family)